MVEGGVQGTLERQVPFGVSGRSLPHEVRGMGRSVSTEGWAGVVPVSHGAYKCRRDLMHRGRLMHGLRYFAVARLRLAVARGTRGLFPFLTLPNPPIGGRVGHDGRNLDAADFVVQTENAFRVLDPPGLEAPALRVLPIGDHKAQ